MAGGIVRGWETQFQWGWAAGTAGARSKPQAEGLPRGVSRQPAESVAVRGPAASVPASEPSESGETFCFILAIQEFCIQLPNLSGFLSLYKKGFILFH